MKKQVIVVILTLCLVFPAYAKKGSKGKKKGKTNTTQQVKKAAAQEAKNLPPEPTHASTNLEWGAGYVDFSKPENQADLAKMITIPDRYSPEEVKIILGEVQDKPVKKKAELARRNLTRAQYELPEWFQVRYLLGLLKYFEENPSRASVMDNKYLCFIRFMEQYVLPQYLNVHRTVVLTDSYHFKLRETLHKLNDFSLINATSTFSSSRTNDAGITYYFDEEPKQGKNPHIHPGYLEAQTSPQQPKKGRNVGSPEGELGGEPGGSPKGDIGGDPNGSPNGSEWGSPDGTKEGRRRIVPLAFPYNDHVHELRETGGDVPELFVL